jgi:hypothetical protein
MLRKAGVVAAVAAVVGLTAVSPASAAGACALQGAASIPSGLTTKTKPINYTFSGKLSNCQGVKGYTGGTVSASGSGTGSCTGNKTSGKATIKWNNGQTSALSYTTNGTGTVITVAGKFTSGAFAGQKLSADLLFYTVHPEKCNTAAGLTAASFAGPATLGV